MNITWTDEAAEKLKEITGGKNGYVKLIIDTEDCGCSDDGEASLWFIAEPEGNEEEFISNIGPFLVDADKVKYLEDPMKIQWVADFNSFRLTTPNGILHPFVKLYNWVK